MRPHDEPSSGVFLESRTTPDIGKRPRSRPRLRRLGEADSQGRVLRLPAVGDQVFGFRLREELGRGAFARVFLAEQADLAGRPVVLKVSGLEGDEPQTLAQLQHTHIVPIYSVHEDKDAGLRAVCMPYFGGASLSQVLQTLWGETGRPTQGAQLVSALRAVAAQPPSPAAAPEDEGEPAEERLPTAGNQPAPLKELERLSYVRAAAWIMVHLAEAVQHAHERGVLHRDIKPSNVLLGGDGQPMLLDFNVAQRLRHTPKDAFVGGTVAYMAPEHLRALATPDPILARQVDHRSDIYSLGMVLYELLTGRSPFDLSASYSPALPLVTLLAIERSRIVPSLRQKRADVPWSLESIARKCLAPDPAQRYQQAEHLAEDLRRFLDDRPLKHAPELSRTERVRKWLRRHPRLTSSGTVVTVAVLLTALLAGALLTRLAGTREQLAVAQAQEKRRAYEKGVVRALCLVNTTADGEDHLRQGVTACEEALALYGALDRDDWEEGEEWRRLGADNRQRLAEDARELMLALAWARVRTGTGDRQRLRQALALLDRAEAIADLAPSRALWEDRATYLDQLGDTEGAREARKQAEQLRPASARDHYLLATTYARAGRHAEAIKELNQALALNPRHYWSAVQRGICHQEMGNHTLAAGDFGACIGLWPEFAWGWFNRGVALDQCGSKAEAIDDYTAALERDSAFVLAYLNRGLARLELRQYGPALADLRKAAELGRDDAFLHAGLGVALEGLQRPAEADAAFAAAFARAGAAPKETRARLHWVYGFAVASRLPDKARHAFEEVLRTDPDNPQALYGKAMLLAQQHEEAEAIKLFGRALETKPNFLEARRSRAVLLARCGRFEEASQDMNWCLEKEPTGGATLYAAACVAARAVEKSSDPKTAQQAEEQALALLARAFARGYGQDRAETDADLTALWKRPGFQRLMQEQAAGKPASE